mgnify:CR=1 FL=1
MKNNKKRVLFYLAQFNSTILKLVFLGVFSNNILFEKINLIETKYVII